MQSDQEIKEMVKRKYSEIAEQDVAFNQASCCGCGEASTEVYNIMTDDYSGTAGYADAADLGLGCGLPTAFAGIEKGNTVLDLGSGAGNDVFIARHECGIEGKVIGVDFSSNMIRKARQNADDLGYNNVEFREGDIEDLPVSDATIDVIVSNCVLNLVPNKAGVFKEMFRVMKPGGHFSISDVVLQGELPEALQKEAELYAGCVSGAIQKSEYLALIKAAGFSQISIQKEKLIRIPNDILSKYLKEEDLAAFGSNQGIYSITVFAQKPGVSQKPKKALASLTANSNCEPNSGCC
jgi:SAM-dependent methyltransferase